MDATISLPLITFIAKHIGLAHEKWRATSSPRYSLRAHVAALENRLARVEFERDLLRSRLARVPAMRRPHYTRAERLQILYHAARYGIGSRTLAPLFLLSRQTVMNWRRHERDGNDVFFSAVNLRRLPAIVDQLVHRLRSEWPAWGTRRVVDQLVRMGVEASRSSVQRIVKRPSLPMPDDDPPVLDAQGRRLLAKRPNHIWMLDFTRLKGRVRKTWVGAIIDVHSRKVLAMASIRKAPTSAFACRLIRAAAREHGSATWFVTDQDPIVRRAKNVNALARRLGMRRRYGAVGRKGSIAIIERFWKSMKVENARHLNRHASIGSIDRKLSSYAEWFNAHRPHQGLDGMTPDEVFFEEDARTPFKRTDGVMHVSFVDGDARLPILELRAA